jgi:hypothetical protein
MSNFQIWLPVILWLGIAVVALIGVFILTMKVNEK